MQDPEWFIPASQAFGKEHVQLGAPKFLLTMSRVQELSRQEVAQMTPEHLQAIWQVLCLPSDLSTCSVIPYTDPEQVQNLWLSLLHKLDCREVTIVRQADPRSLPVYIYKLTIRLSPAQNIRARDHVSMWQK